MCGTCGCAEGPVWISTHQHHHGEDTPREIELHLDIMAKNDRHAAANRRYLKSRGILALNLVSSPGSGKTALLVRTVAALGPSAASVIEGDQQTSRDAERIRAAGARAVQINTGRICHLDAHMVGHALHDLAPDPGGVVFIENVGNLVCPAGFDLGEARRVVVLSVTEGEDKPLKYPDIFATADLALINKTDLLPHLDFDMDAVVGNARRINPGLEILPVSARTGEGFAAWLAWIEAARSRLAGSRTVGTAAE